MAQTAARPALTLDVALSNSIPSRNQASKIAVQSRASAQAPQAATGAPGTSSAAGSGAGMNGMGSRANGGSMGSDTGNGIQQQPLQVGQIYNPHAAGAGSSAGNEAIGLGLGNDVILVDDHGGFSSEEDDPDAAGGYASNKPRRLGKGTATQSGYANGGQQYVGDDSDSDDYGATHRGPMQGQAGGQGQQGGMEVDEEEASDDDGEEYDEDDEDDDLSSSPSIPDENIDFDLVYALHNFVATVEGQATVHKGNSLTLLDDSNSYWWLVRVLRTQEVGYIPAENIETPFERLARLNKHRNVDLTSATDDDKVQVAQNIHASHLIKSRTLTSREALSAHSGKLSALSRRQQGAPTTAMEREKARRRDEVSFGPSTYLEHSGNEYSSDEEEDGEEYEDDEEEDDDDDEAIHMDDGERGFVEEEGGSSGEEIEEDGIHPAPMVTSAEDRQRHLQQQQQRLQQQQQQQIGQQQSRQLQQQQPDGYNRIEPDDGMEWDAEATRAAQAVTLEAQQQQQLQQKQMAGAAAAVSAVGAVLAVQQQQQGLRPSESLTGRTSPLSSVQPLQARASQEAGRRSVDARRSQDASQGRASHESYAAGRLAANEQRPGSGFLPSQIQATRDSMASSDTSGRLSSEMGGAKEERRKSANRKSKGDDDELTGAGGEEKQSKKRSGVFSGLFSRNKEKKERKSGSFAGSVDSDLANLGRTSEESNRGRSTPTGPGSLSRSVQEKDRISQQAYQKHLLSAGGQSFTDEPSPRMSGRRPGSLIGPPGSAPMLNVLRVFAGDDIESDATFKTVLLNDSTNSRDLVKQAMQRFRLGHGHSPDEYVLTVRLLEGDERILHPSEQPLQVFDALTEAHPETTMPSVKRSSIGSISSISSNLSLNPAIARLGNDFSDDHAVKFFLCRRSTLAAASQQKGLQTAGPNAAWQSADINNLSGDSMLSRGAPITASGNNDPTARFVLRLLIFPSDLPESMVFDPQTNALIPKEVLMQRKSSGLVPAEGISQQYREKILPFPRNTTVAEVIEAALDRFGIEEGVVEGGDDVEERMMNRRSKARVRYGLSVDLNRVEKRLVPNSRVVDAYPRPPILKPATKSLDGKRRSLDAATLMGLMDDIRAEDPVFILRQVSTISKSKTARSLSPTQEALVNKQEQRRQAELQTVAPQPSASAVREATQAAAVAPNAAAMSRQEVIAAQRAAAKAAVLGAQQNEMQGMDVVLTNQARIRSSKSDGGRIRYSYIPVDGAEMDISSIIEEVLRDEVPFSGELAAVDDNSRRPSLGVPGRIPSRSGQSDITFEDYESATEDMPSASPLSLKDVNYVLTTPRPPLPASNSQGLQVGSRSATPTGLPKRQPDLLETVVKNSRNSEHVLGERIDEVLARMSVNGPMSSTPVVATRALPPYQGFTQAPAASSYKSPVKATAPLRVRNLGVEHMYALMDAATASRSVAKHQTPLDILNERLESGGLFPKPMPALQDQKLREKYVALNQELRSFDDTLDRLLADALRL